MNKNFNKLLLCFTLTFLAIPVFSKMTSVHDFRVGGVSLNMTEAEIKKARPDLEARNDGDNRIRYTNRAEDNPYIQDQQITVLLTPELKQIYSIEYYVYFDLKIHKEDIIKKTVRHYLKRHFGAEDALITNSGKTYSSEMMFCWGYCPLKSIDYTSYSKLEPWHSMIPGRRLVVKEIMTTDGQLGLKISLNDGMMRLKNEDRIEGIERRDYDAISRRFVNDWASITPTPNYVKDIEKHINL
jgi:hypothetical protein